MPPFFLDKVDTTMPMPFVNREERRAHRKHNGRKEGCYLCLYQGKTTGS